MNEKDQNIKNEVNIFFTNDDLVDENLFKDFQKLYIYREWNDYHVGFFDDHVCIAINIDEACKIILQNLNSHYANITHEAIEELKKGVQEFDLKIGYKKYK